MRENTAILEGTVEKLLELKKYSTIRDLLSSLNAADVAAIFEELDEKSIPLLFRLLPKELAAEVFVEMDSDDQELLIHGFSDSELKDVVDELYVDDAADIVEEMPANVVKRILRQTDPEMRKTINEILNYPEDSAGSIMTTEYVSLRPAMTAEEAIKRIRRVGVDKETIYTCYVTEDDRTLIGYISIRKLLLADENDRIRDIMDEHVISVATGDDQEDVVQQLGKYGFIAMPVVDRENRLVGIVTVDDAIDVIQEEATEDMEKMAAIVTTDKPYMKLTVFDIFRARMPWLLFLMVLTTVAGLIISGFGSALQAQLVLCAFIPMVMGTGGNAGIQSSVSVIRGLSLKEIDFSDFFAVIWKEIRVSVISGAVLAVVCFVKMILLDANILSGGVTPQTALAVSAALLITVVCAKLIGCIMPLLADRLKLDPAILASPVITTVVDMLALVIYFLMAKAMLPV